MKYFFTILISIMISLSSLSAVYANDVTAEDTDLLNLPFIEDVMLTRYAEMANKFLNSIEDSDETVSIKGTAPALTYLQVYAAASTNYPTWEYFSQSQYSSSIDHGGAELYILTVELGYGASPVAKMDGNTLTQVDVDTITNSSGVVIGFYRLWDASGYEEGKFTYQNRSTNYPGNLMSDWINIQ